MAARLLLPEKVTRLAIIDGRTFRTVNDLILGTTTRTTPEGRTSSKHYDTTTLLTQRSIVPGLLDTTYGYDTRGRLTSVTTGDRSLSYAYDGQGNLASVTNPLNRTISYTYDANGRPHCKNALQLTRKKLRADARAL